MIYKKALFPIFFGDKNSCPANYLEPEFHTYCAELAQKLGLQKFVILNQVHGNAGLCIDSSNLPTQENPISLFQTDGDYLVTNVKNIGIGVLTADCLPVIIQDQIKNVVAVIHAGWPGTVLQITQKALETMHDKYGTNPKTVQVYFGPSAKPCCYEVKKDFYTKIQDIPEQQIARITKSIITRENKFFFDNPGCNKLQLIDSGVPEAHIHEEQNMCTICHTQFYSFRREKEKASRQLTISWI